MSDTQDRYAWYYKPEDMKRLTLERILSAVEKLNHKVDKLIEEQEKDKSNG